MGAEGHRFAAGGGVVILRKNHGNGIGGVFDSADSVCQKNSRRTACEIGRGGVYGAPVFFRKRKRRKKNTFRQEIARKIVRFSDFRSSPPAQ